jgi:poly(glycerol-phosphate) alpha-glucosyltransferase
MQEKKSGIEHAQIKRLQLFKDHGVNAKILTRDYDRTLHYQLAESGIDDDDLINVFDYLQKATHYTGSVTTIDQLHFPEGSTISQESPQLARVYFNGHQIGQISMFVQDTTRIDSVTYYDLKGNTVRIDMYDLRGFKSLEQVFGADNNPIVDRMYTPDGQLVFESTWQEDRHNVVKNSLMRVIYNGQSFSFNGNREMFRWFLDTINTANGEDNVFIEDRMEDDWSVLRMRTSAKKILHIHAVHTNDQYKMKTASINVNYEYALFNLDQWDGIIVSTNRQRNDIIDRWHPKIPVYAIPVGVVSETLRQQPHPDFSTRKQGELVAVARRAPEKRLDHVIKAVEQVEKNGVPVHFDIYGYGEEKITKQLEDLIADHKLSSFVALNNYSQNIDAVYNQAQLMVLTSTSEGFALVVLEALAHGVPVVAYDIPYGPAEMIQDGQSGRLIPDGNIDELGKAITELLSDQGKLAEMSQQAYQASQRFSEEEVWQKWQSLVNDYTDAK